MERLLGKRFTVSCFADRRCLFCRETSLPALETSLARPMRAILAKVRAKVLQALGFPIWAVLSGVTALLSFAMKPQVLFVVALLIGIYPGTCCWLRPPMSADISAFSLPVLGHTDADAVAFVQGDRPFELLSAGMVISAIAVMGLLASLFLKIRMSSVAGVFFAVLLGCQLSLLFNHPAIIVQIAREGQLRDAVVALLEDTAEPAIDITAFPRVKSLQRLVEPGSIESAVNFVPYAGTTFLVIALLTFVLVSRGSTLRRLAMAGVWTTFGLLLFIALSWPRLASEWHWHCAVVAEQTGNLCHAAAHVEQARTFFPSLVEVPCSWMLEGKIDYQRNQLSAARQYYLACQKARNGEIAQALFEVAAIKENREWSIKASQSLVNRWMGDLLATQAMKDFQQGQFDTADQRWDLAMNFDSSIVYRPLCLAVLRSRWQGSNPEEVIKLVNPVLDRLADRALKAALYAMVGDCFFAAGEFSVAREYYQTSLDVYSLPKTINYRALRGLLGW